MRNKYFDLLSNSIILFIANFGSQLLSFFLVPLFTFVLSTEEYGTVDIFVTTLSIIVPIATLSISEATLRFSMDKDIDRKGVLSISIYLTLIGDAIVLAILPFLKDITGINEYLLILWLAVLFNSLYLVTSLYCRGNGNVKRYALGGILSTISSLICNILFLLKFNMGIKGYLLALVASYAIPTVFYFFSFKLWKQMGKIKRNLLKEMLAYSIPMIPGALAWLMVSSSDKYILVYYWGVSLNGIYTVTQKIPSLINVVNSIFMQSWQLSAVAEMNSDDKESFYSNVFNTLASILLIITVLVTAIIKPLYSFWVEQSYFEAWKYTTILMVANIFSCFSNFVGTNYIAMKRTTGNMKTLLLGGFLNIVMNIVLVPKYGIYAASVTTLLSFLFTWVYRTYDTKNFIKISIDNKKIITMFTIIFVQYISLYLDFYIYLQPIFIAIVLLLYRYEISAILLWLKNIFNNKKGKK